MITIDDGWKQNFDLIPVIKKFNIRPTIFLTAKLIDTHRKFWWTVCSPKDNQALKKVSNQQRLSILKEKYDYYPEKIYEDIRQTLNQEEVIKMSEYVEFGLHTCYHPILTQCTYDEKEKEIIESKQVIEKMIGRPIDSFAFPNGNYDDKDLEILNDAGIRIARTVKTGWNDVNRHPLQLRNTGVSDNGSLHKLASELTGIPVFFQYLFLK
ncbi:MAG: polysaccharide deacetylase family protein [Bacteroidales bacterium]|nr:polysaccharide deacetylase family protein [Bacteroidales bacterium]